MPEHDPLILSYSHLKAFPREKEAFHALKKVASLVKPIMRARGWRVRELAEFFPEQDNLLGEIRRSLRKYFRLYLTCEELILISSGLQVSMSIRAKKSFFDSDMPATATSSSPSSK